MVGKYSLNIVEAMALVHKSVVAVRLGGGASSGQRVVLVLRFFAGEGEGEGTEVSITR
jgi:hypothetical protein